MTTLLPSSRRLLGAFQQFAKTVVRTSGHPTAFALAIGVIVIWALTGPFFRDGSMWLLVINTIANLITFLMIFLIRNAQNRESEAVQLKLDELIRATKEARNTLLDIEELSESELDRIKSRFERLAKKAREDVNPLPAAVAAALLAFVLLAPSPCPAQEPASTNGPTTKASESTPGPGPTTYEGTNAPPKVGSSEETVAGETWGDHSYVIPFLEVVTFEATLNLYDRTHLEEEIYGTSWDSFQHNFGKAPVVDSDTFQINQLYHPYQGAMYFGFGRSAGLSYWQSLFYSIGGSELWETAGETGPPSFNDQIASGIGGSFLGEPLFRMASLVLEGGGREPGFLRELAAACISPPTGINRLLFGSRFDKVFPSHNPPTFVRLRLGYSTQAREVDNSSKQTVDRQEASLDFLMSYGIPGKPGYTYDRPFDYFNFEFAAGTGGDSFHTILSRGLLYGTDYEWGDAYRGIWGLYGSYDYISPQIFRVSSTALSLGTTYQWWMVQNVAVQGTTMGGLGYAAAGTIAGPEERNYRYGATPQGLMAIHVIMGHRAMIDLTGREYYISDYSGTEPGGHEVIGRGNIGLTVRVYGQHAIGLQYTATTRDSHVDGGTDRHQTEEIASIAYTLLGDDNFGVVEY